MRIEKTEAVIINCMDWSETSRIVSFYTKDNGRLKAVVKGSRRNNSPFRGTLELFSHVDLVYYDKRGRDLQTVSQCSVKNHFPGIKKSLTKTAYCSYFAQMVDESSAGNEKSEGLFNLLLEIFLHLEENGASGMLARYFELNFLKESGYMPLLKECSLCGNQMEIPLRRAGFSPGTGGVICEDCMDRNREFLMISGGTLSTMMCLERMAIERLGRLQVSSSVKDELKESLSCYLEYHLEKKLKSLDFLNILQEGGGDER